MKKGFQFLALSEILFNSYFLMSDDMLKKHNARWLEVKSNPGYPCRVTLEDAKVGERVLALPFNHHDVNSPYRAMGPIFVRENAKQSSWEANEIPKMMLHRTLSVRGYNASGTMIEAELIEGENLASRLPIIFENSNVEYIHIHNAKPGCFNCTVVRA